MFRIDPKQAVLDHVARQGATGAQAALSDVADQVVRAPVETNYSGAVIVGVAQLLEALLLATLGLGIYGAYVADGDPVFYLPLDVVRANEPRAVPYAAVSSFGFDNLYSKTFSATTGSAGIRIVEMKTFAI